MSTTKGRFTGHGCLETDGKIVFALLWLLRSNQNASDEALIGVAEKKHLPISQIMAQQLSVRSVIVNQDLKMPPASEDETGLRCDPAILWNVYGILKIVTLVRPQKIFDFFTQCDHQQKHFF